MGRKRLQAGWRVSARQSPWRGDSGHLMLSPPGVCLGREHSLPLQIPASPEGSYRLSTPLFGGQFPLCILFFLSCSPFSRWHREGASTLCLPPPSQQAGGAPGGPFLSCPLLSPQHGRCTDRGLDRVGSDSQLGSYCAANCSQQLHLVAFVSRRSCIPGTGEDPRVKQGFAGCFGIIITV